ncbi:MAG: DEAD/DEAH box helicase family protein [Treponema sp.]|nr:DEAD/DEAH box helicase family protein [Treponema sp.]
MSDDFGEIEYEFQSDSADEINDIYDVTGDEAPRKIEKLNVDSVAACLSKNGPLSKIYGHYEERPSQVELLKSITEVFNSDSVGVFEAGTGVGKSFAYLIPSMLWAVKNQERVVISTGTINLQQQVFEKDIPLAEKVIGKKIRAILVKGRQNYVCLRRLSEVVNEPDLFSDDMDIFEKIFAWSKKTKDGSRSDLSFQPPENIWQRVNSESDACMGMRCKHYSKCFVMKMKKDASEANLLVVNHHILFADIESRMEGAGFDSAAVLPTYKRIVFDEAHGVESAATSFFSQNLNRFKLIKQLNLLCRRKRGAISGFLYTISALSESEDKSAEIEIEIEKSKEIFSDLEKSADSFLKNDFTARLHLANSKSFEPVMEKISELKKSVAKIVTSIRSVLDGIDELDRDEAAVWETKSVLRRLDACVTVCQNYLDWKEHPELVFWIQKSRLPPSLAAGSDFPFYFQFVQTPLDISSLMNEGVFEPMKSVVCTSATLGIEGKFDFWEKRTGVSFVNPERVRRGVFSSPFPYDKNMILAVPSDAPFPDNQQFQQFLDFSVARLILAANGRTLVLFTSYDMLRKTFDGVSDSVKNSGITILKQGDDDRFRLLSKFKEDTSSVLFATDSFWEGVDVPGESLRQVVIVKLPFGVPSDPVFSARSEIIEKNGGNSFMELSVPEAVIKFRQGFGRLIRRGDDKGAVVVLDRRIIEKRYGSIFVSSVPRTRHAYEPLSNLIMSAKAYL